MNDDSILYGRLEPCQTVNPVLWRLFCMGVLKRDAMAPSHHWTERDVFELLARRQKIYTDIIDSAVSTDIFNHDPS